MKNNAELQADVQNAIKWEPLLNAAEIGVTAKDGVVSFTGLVDSYSKKLEAGRIAWKTSGIWHVKNELIVDYEYAFS